MNSSDSAEEIVRLSLEGMEVAFKIAGAGAKNIAVAMYTIMKDKQQTKGKTRLTNMLKTGKPLKIFTIKAEDLKKFSQEAKRYGVLYCALANRKNSKIDGMVDIMVREEDASKINRIAERFNFKDVATIKKELELEKKKQHNEQEKNEQEIPKSEDEQFIDDIMPKEKEEKEIPSNTKKNTEKSQSEISSNTKLNDKVESSKEEKRSVKEELKEIEQEIKNKEQKEKQQEIGTGNFVKSKKKKEAKHYKEKEEKPKGKRFKEPKHLDTTPKSKRRKKNKERSK